MPSPTPGAVDSPADDPPLSVFRMRQSNPQGPNQLHGEEQPQGQRRTQRPLGKPQEHRQAQEHPQGRGQVQEETPGQGQGQGRVQGRTPGSGQGHRRSSKWQIHVRTHCGTRFTVPLDPRTRVADFIRKSLKVLGTPRASRGIFQRRWASTRASFAHASHGAVLKLFEVCALSTAPPDPDS